jgi:hypothetical protein
LNLKNLPNFDNKSSLRDEYSSPVFSLRYLKLVLGVDDYRQLKLCSEYVMDNRDIVIKELKDRYCELFEDSADSIGLVVKDIESSIASYN